MLRSEKDLSNDGLEVVENPLFDRFFFRWKLVVFNEVFCVFFYEYS